MNNENRSKTPLIVGALLGIAVIGALVAWVTGVGKDPANQQEASNPNAAGNGTVPTEQVPQTKYADGSYSAGGSYTSPAGAETVNVSLTLAGDVISDVTFSGNATNPASVRMQSQFSQGYREMVVGKSIDEVSLTVVNGSSLTPKGFMDAIVKIQAQAMNPTQAS
jgi:uncharacterized protein with FMN-binding domain